MNCNHLPHGRVHAIHEGDDTNSHTDRRDPQVSGFDATYQGDPEIPLRKSRSMNASFARRILFVERAKSSKILQRRSMSSSPSFPVQAAIQEKLTAAFSPTHLEVINESHMHNV